MVDTRDPGTGVLGLDEPEWVRMREDMHRESSSGSDDDDDEDDHGDGEQRGGVVEVEMSDDDSGSEYDECPDAHALRVGTSRPGAVPAPVFGGVQD